MFDLDDDDDDDDVDDDDVDESHNVWKIGRCHFLRCPGSQITTLQMWPFLKVGIDSIVNTIEH